MRALLQRVCRAHVEVGGRTVGEIGSGLVVLLGISQKDTPEDAAFLAEKVLNLRIFSDEAGKMNRSAIQVGASLLVISQFTLYGDCRRGRRPSFDQAARPELARALYEVFVDACRSSGLTVETGIFGAMMRVHLVNDGPVTLLCDSDGNR